MKTTSYLVFNGQAEQTAGFYAEALGGKNRKPQSLKPVTVFAR